ncbi:ATP synthase H chain [Morchella snyderi]|nr:ATP synthase H chain [Morchella snyderi]
MLVQSIRASRSSLTRYLARQPTFTRAFIAPTAVRQADIVQDIYLRELKAYKTPTAKASDSEGQVKKWNLPAAPKSPEEAEASLAEQLKAYETQEVEVEGQAAAGEPAEAAVEEDWFEEELTFTEPEAHGH